MHLVINGMICLALLTFHFHNDETFSHRVACQTSATVTCCALYGGDWEAVFCYNCICIQTHTHTHTHFFGEESNT